MASISKPPPIFNLNAYSLSSPRQYFPTLSFPFRIPAPSRLCALKTGSDGRSGRLERHEAYDQDLLRKPVVSPGKGSADIVEERQESQQNGNYEDEWVDWEDKIFEDTVPLVGFVRTILHSGKYESGDHLSLEHERTILERLLPFHPEFEKKIGCGIDYIMVGYHPDFERSRCLFIVQKDGNLVDFSYWKCIKGLIRKKYPLYADSFILRHFRQRRRRY